MASHSESKVVLVTGAAGFTGRYVTRAFQRAGYRVVAWGNRAVEAAHVDSLVELTDRFQVERALKDVQPDVVVHLAGIAFVAHQDIGSIYQVNVLGTRNLLVGLQQSGKRPSRVLLASSANIYGNVGGIIDEQSMPLPANDYAVSKIAMEYMSRQFHETLPITVVRPFNYTGVGQSEAFLIPKIVSHFRRREPVIELGNINVGRDFNDVRNVAESYLRLATEGRDGEAYNLCTGVEHKLADVIAMMSQIAGYDIEVKVNPAFVRKNEVHTLVGDPRKLHAAIGELPGIQLASTLRWMYESSGESITSRSEGDANV